VITLSSAAAGITNIADMIFKIERSCQRQILSIFIIAATSIITTPIKGITHVSVMGYCSRKFIVIRGNITHAAIPIKVEYIETHPRFVIGRIFVFKSVYSLSTGIIQVSLHHNKICCLYYFRLLTRIFDGAPLFPLKENSCFMERSICLVIVTTHFQCIMM
jgi:uncharacterized membrane protein